MGSASGVDQEVRLEDPPPAWDGHRRDWRKVCDLCDANPGRWVRVGIMDRSVATHIRNRRYPSVDPSLYQVVARRQANIEYSGRSQMTLFMRRRADG